MDILVRGRNVEVPDHFRQHVADKLQRIERFDQKIIRVDVELYHERNPRQSNSCQRVEITCASRGPVVRSEACAADFYSALDVCVTKIDGRMRRAADRRRVHHGARTPTSVAAATGASGQVKADLNGSRPPAGMAATAVLAADEVPAGRAAERAADDRAADDRAVADRAADDRAADDRAGVDWADGDELAGHGPGRIVRVKEHPAKPMTLDQALFEMELVGHDFYLFSDADTDQPSVVYRRRGYDYGVIRLTS